MHLQPDLDEVHRPPKPYRDHAGYHAGQKQVIQAVVRAGLRLPTAMLAKEPPDVAEDPKHY